MTPEIFYINRLPELKARQKKLKQKKSIFAGLRLGSIAAVIAAFYFLWAAGVGYAVSAGIVFMIFFIRLIYKDLANRAAIMHLEHLININNDELKALNGEHNHFEDGTKFLPKDHPYAADIDLFGHASLYQLLNRATSDMGASRLAGWLLNAADANTIRLRQDGIKELADKAQWRQDFQAYGKEKVIRQETYARLKEWLHEPTLFLQFTHWKWLRILLPAIISPVSVSAIAGWIPMNVMYAFLFGFAIIAYQINKIISPLHEKLSKMVDEMEVLSISIALIEKASFKANILADVQQKFITGHFTASSKLSRLKKILDQFDLRYNIVLSAPLNLLLLWNLQQVLDLEEWKMRNASAVEGWFTGLGEMEALSSLANLHFNNPGWAFPTLTDQLFFLEAQDLGHPLINIKKRVNNFIQIKHPGEIMLVTGSNMAGKSTYLRSVGINVVLAMAGAPVCASKMKLSPVHLISSMRIADNLEESTSTFYAELKKLKTVIDKVNNKEKIFILLDEILRGTNSLDRHTGSVALIRQLIKQKASGIIATHDLALAEMHNDFPAHILNFHFDAHITNDELYFDYLLKPGVCKSLNASLLMKKIGIELE